MAAYIWWKPPPQPMITCLVRKTVLWNPGSTSSFVLLAGPFSSSVAPTSLPNFSSSLGGSWRDSICLAKACAAAFSLVTTMTFKVRSMTTSLQLWQQQHGFSQPQRLHWWNNPFVLPRMDWTKTISTAQKVAVRIRHQRSNGLQGLIECAVDAFDVQLGLETL